VDTEGQELFKYAPHEYLNYVAEHVEPWSYLKFPYLKTKGWKGFVEGKDSGVYHATPLSRLNAADGMATPVAQQEYEFMYKTLGGKPVHNTLAMHWARLVELIYSAEHCLELAKDPEIIGTDLRAPLDKIPTEGVGIVEAQRGTLTHHYWTDPKGIVTKANIIVGTTNNHAPICMSIKKTAEGLIKKDTKITEGILNMVEMSFRAYDPCFSCATHSLPGQMRMELVIKDSQGKIIRSVKRK
jgi:F420-non-reducing hydrogenase large subunit